MNGIKKLKEENKKLKRQVFYWRECYKSMKKNYIVIKQKLTQKEIKDLSIKRHYFVQQSSFGG